MNYGQMILATPSWNSSLSVVENPSIQFESESITVRSAYEKQTVFIGIGLVRTLNMTRY